MGGRESPGDRIIPEGVLLKKSLNRAKKTSRLREIKTPRKDSDVLKPKREKWLILAPFHKLFKFLRNQFRIQTTLIRVLFLSSKLLLGHNEYKQHQINR